MADAMAAASVVGGETAAQLSSEKEEVSSFLGSVVRVKSTDGRVISGKFICLDNACNVVLESAYIVGPATAARMGPTRIGNWIIPGALLASIEVPEYAGDGGDAESAKSSSGEGAAAPAASVATEAAPREPPVPLE